MIIKDKILEVKNLTHYYGEQVGCEDISFDLYQGEILGIVGESGSGKSTLLKCLSGQISPSQGIINFCIDQNQPLQDLCKISEQKKRALMRKEWGIVQQNPRDGLRLRVSAGGNIAERIINEEIKNYSNIRHKALEWMDKTEMEKSRIDDFPLNFSGGMQQRLQISKILSSNPKLVYMDEPTGGLDVSVQAKLLDTITIIVRDLNVSMIIVSHDLAVVKFLTDKLLVMKSGMVVESGLTDRVLDDPPTFLHTITDFFNFASMNPSIKTTNLQKTFTLHNQNSTELKVLKNINFSISPGECVALTGKSGTGKSTFLRMLYGNYLPTAGTIEVLYQDTYYDLVHSLEHQIIYLRKHAIGYVSQFLVVIPRVSTFDIISNTLKQQGTLEDGSNEKISHLLETLNIKKNMWHLPPMTFSGGEQQRVNIAKTFIGDYPILFLDEPTSALDKENTKIVLDLIKSKLNKNVAIITIIHDAIIRNQICTREFNLENFTEG